VNGQNMTSEQNQEALKRVDEAIRKHRIALTMTPLFFVGVIDTVRALHKHDKSEAIIASIVWFLLAPLVAIGIRKLTGTAR